LVFSRQWKKQALAILQTGFEDQRQSARTEQDHQALTELLIKRQAIAPTTSITKRLSSPTR
jgi:hypothetical protein